MSPERAGRVWTARVQDIIDAVDEINRFVDGMDRAAFIADPKTVKAVLADFQIIGEATSHVPREVQDAYPAVPWKLMRQMRNVVVHVYFAVEPVIVWQTIQDNLPGLRSQLAAILEGDSKAARGGS